MTSYEQPRRLFENQNPTSGYTLRKMYGFYEGQVYKIFSRLPLYKTQVNPEQIRRFKMIMDSMTDIELDDLDPENMMSAARIVEIARVSKQGLALFREMMNEFTRLRRVWRNVEKLMSDSKLMDMSALFWNEMATPFNIEIVPKAENIHPRKLFPHKVELMDWVKWALIYFGTFIFCFLLGMNIP